MHTEFAHYFTSLRLLEQFRWALAGCFAFAAVRLYRVSASMMPEAHPTRRYMTARIEAAERTVLPAMETGLPCWIKRLGQITAAIVLVLILALVAIGAARAGHHYHHIKQERGWELFTK